MRHRVAMAALMAVALAPLRTRAQEPELTGAGAIAEAVLWGRAMPPPERTANLPPVVQAPLAEYRRREVAFRSALTPPRDATIEEQRVFEQRVGIERVVFCLFARRDSARVAAAYALDADIGFGQAAFIDGLLHDRAQPWLAPYLNLIAGDLKLCEGQVEEGRRQLTSARDSGDALIRFVAETLLTQKRCQSELFDGVSPGLQHRQ